VLDAGDALALLRHAAVDVVLCGRRHAPYVWPVAGMLLVHSGTAATLRTRAFTEPAYNLIRADADRISVQLRVPGAHGRSGELSARLAGGAIGTLGRSARAPVAGPRSGQPLSGPPKSGCPCHTAEAFGG